MKITLHKLGPLIDRWRASATNDPDSPAPTCVAAYDGDELLALVTMTGMPSDVIGRRRCVMKAGRALPDRKRIDAALMVTEAWKGDEEILIAAAITLKNDLPSEGWTRTWPILRTSAGESALGEPEDHEASPTDLPLLLSFIAGAKSDGEI